MKILLILATSGLLACHCLPHAKVSDANDENSTPTDEPEHEWQDSSSDGIENESLGNSEDDISGRGAIFGHSPIAANPHGQNDFHGYLPPGMFSPLHNEANIPQFGDHQLPQYLKDHIAPFDEVPISPFNNHQDPSPIRKDHPTYYNKEPIFPHEKDPSLFNYASGEFDYKNAGDLKEALKHIHYAQWLVTGHSKYMKEHKCPREESQDAYHSAKGRVSCQPEAWKNCNCISPAEFSKEGRGNCNLGATQPDVKVWCYVDPTNGDPARVCPDSKPSKTKYGRYWSRFACIT